MKHYKYGSNNKYCLVSIQVGSRYKQHWEVFFKRSWQRYAERMGYDILIVDEVPDVDGEPSVASIKIQKFKLLTLDALENYDKIVYLDTDILICDNAPCIASQVEVGKIGMVSECYIPYYEWFLRVKENYPTIDEPEAYYKKHLLPDELAIADGVDDIMNGGVVVIGGQGLRPFFDDLYDRYLPNIHRKTGHIDQPILSCEAIKQKVLHKLDYRFNMIVPVWGILNHKHSDMKNATVWKSIMLDLTSMGFFLHFPSFVLAEYIPCRFLDMTKV